MKKSICLFLSIIGIIWSCRTGSKENSNITVFCAASLTPVIAQLKDAWEKDHEERILINAASSGVLARQIENGAEADIFLSANEDWMNYLKAKMQLKPDPVTIAHNSLVVIASNEFGIDSMDFKQFITWAVTAESKISIGDPGHVPLGKYAKEAIQSFGNFDDLSPKLILTMDARSALRLVELGEAAVGFAYYSDAISSDHVKIIAEVPAESHKEIAYQAIMIHERKPVVKEFFEFMNSDKHQGIWLSNGFKK